MDTIMLILVTGIVLIGAVMMAFYCFWHYEFGIVLLLLSPWLASSLRPDDVTTVDQFTLGGYLRNVTLLFLGIIGTVRFFFDQTRAPKPLPSYFLLLLIYLLFSLLSMTYSIDQKYTLIRSGNFIAFFLFLLGMYQWLQDEESFARAFNAIFRITSVCLIANFISIFVLGNKAFECCYRLIGLTTQPNELGSFIMVIYPFLLWKYGKSIPIMKCWCLMLIFIALTMHVLTGSRGSLLATFLALNVWLFIRRKFAVIAISVLIMTLAMMSMYELKLANFQREESTEITTGRIDFWKGSYILFKEKPFLGYGYGVEGKIWKDPRFTRDDDSLWMGSAKASLHNGYLSVLIGGGIVAFLVFFVSVLTPFWQCLSVPYSDYKAVFYAVLAMVLFLNFVESMALGPTPISSAVFFLVWVMAGRWTELVHIMDKHEVNDKQEGFCCVRNLEKVTT